LFSFRDAGFQLLRFRAAGRSMSKQCVASSIDRERSLLPLKKMEHRRRKQGADRRFVGAAQDIFRTELRGVRKVDVRATEELADLGKERLRK
jgi:hypothetical protein